MPHPWSTRLAVAALSMTAGMACHAGQWQVCRMQAQSQGLDKTVSYPRLQAKVLSVEAKPGTECPAIGDTLAFIPDTPDHQASLPRKRWPKVGQTFQMRYQYLDGWCKNDGAEKPCRIKVHPLDNL